MCNICDEKNDMRDMEARRILKAISDKFFKMKHPESFVNKILMRQCISSIEDCLTIISEIDAQVKSIEEIGLKNQDFKDFLKGQLGEIAREAKLDQLKETIMDFCYALYKCNNEHEDDGTEDVLVSFFEENEEYVDYFIDNVLDLSKATVSHH